MLDIKKKLLHSAVYDTLSLTNSLSYTEHTSDPVKSNPVSVFCVTVSVNFVYFVLVL